MALVTLGYDQEKEGFVGTSWAVNVLALAKKIGLIDIWLTAGSPSMT